MIKPLLVKICIANVHAFKFSFFIFLHCTHVWIGCHSILLILPISLLVTYTITNNYISFSGDLFFSHSQLRIVKYQHVTHILVFWYVMTPAIYIFENSKFEERFSQIGFYEKKIFCCNYN